MNALANDQLLADAGRLFPEYDSETMDLKRHQAVIIERILERGT